jgi:hypothetical protein
LIAAAKLGRRGHRDATLVLMAFRYGLRAVEVADLEWSQVEWGRNSALHGKPAVHPIRGDELRSVSRVGRAVPERQIEGGCRTVVRMTTRITHQRRTYWVHPPGAGLLTSSLCPGSAMTLFSKHARAVMAAASIHPQGWRLTTLGVARTARLPWRAISSGHDANQPRSNNQATTGADNRIEARWPIPHCLLIRDPPRREIAPHAQMTVR